MINQLYIISLSYLLILSHCFTLSAISPNIKAEIICEEESVMAGRPFNVAARLHIPDGWHAYSKDCGEVGVPLQIEWELPENYVLESTQWPTSQLFNTAGIESFGYEGEIYVLSRIRPSNNPTEQQSATLKASVEYLICSEEACQPGNMTLSFPLKLSAQEPIINDNVKDAFIKARERLPKISAGSATDIAVLSPVKNNFDVASQNADSIQVNESSTENLLVLLFLAFIGGLILNCMPCVLPVMSLKIMSFVKMAGQSRALIWRHGLAFTGGVVCSFWLLASLMLLLRTYGQSVGWGFQLQEPLFVATLTIILFVLALNLFGLFEWGLSMAAWAGQKEVDAAKTTGITRSFLSGVLATAVATPCTGPFLGSAVGIAVILPFWQSLSIFTFVALGMSSPYLLLAFFPSCLRFLPKPGSWMETFKQLMGFLLCATILWLLWVFGSQTNLFAVICLLSCLLCFTISCWIYGRAGLRIMSRSRLIVSYALITLWALGGIQIMLLPKSSWHLEQEDNAVQIAQASNKKWESFSTNKVVDSHRDGKPVFIDFTAKWCLICQANHIVLNSSQVQKSFQEKGVVALKADWTKNDPAITQALSQFGRNSVPLYVLHVAGQEPMILPQVLTPEIVTSYLEHLPDQKQII